MKGLKRQAKAFSKIFVSHFEVLWDNKGRIFFYYYLFKLQMGFYQVAVVLQ
jgi:hypothetical protein